MGKPPYHPDSPTPMRVTSNRSIFNPWNKETWVNAGDMLLWLTRQKCREQSMNGETEAARAFRYVEDTIRKAMAAC